MAGRPKKEIDQEQFEKLCAIQCTKFEICSWFDVTDKTLEHWVNNTYGRHFSEVFAEKREAGKISLRRSQWRLAEKNASMAIFLGKNYLGQEDSLTHRVNIDTETRQTVEDLLLEAESEDRQDQTEAGD